MDVIVSDIRRGQFKPVYLLYGEESFLRDHRARELAEAVVDKELKDFNCTEFRASETDAATIGSAIMAAPVLSDKRAVVIWDLQDLSDDDRKILAKALERMPDTTVLVIVASTIDKRSALFKAVSKRGRAVLYRRLYPNQALRWLSEYIRSRRIFMDRAALEYLVSVLGTDLAQLVAGVERAYDYAGIALGLEKRITLEHVKSVVMGSPEYSVFDFVDAIGERDAEKAMSSLRQLIVFQEAPLRILYLIARQMRLILKAKALKAGKMSQGEIARALGVQEFVASKCLVQADRFRLEELENAFSLLAEADVSLKTSGTPNHVILERLALHLCDRSCV